MRLKCLMAGLAGIVTVATGSRPATAAIVTYNFGSTSATNVPIATLEAPTSTDANATAGSVTTGATINTSADEGVFTYYSSPGPDYLSFNNSSASSDTASYIDFVVTANAGYTLSPTSLTLVGGAGGASNTRSFLLFDSVDGFPTSIAATSTTPTVTGGSQVGSTTPFTAVRTSSPLVPMNSFTVPFGTSDQNVNSFEVRVYLDTQLNGQQKNVDFSSLTLNGTVNAVSTPEPTVATLGVAALMFGGRRRRHR